MSYNQLDLVILKHITSHKKHGLDFASECDAKVFSPECWNTAQTIISYIRNSNELPTLRVLTEKLSKNGNQKLIETISNVWQRMDKQIVNEKEYKHELEKIKQRFAEKQLLIARDNLVKLEPGADINKSVVDLQKTIQSIKSLDQTKAYESKSIKEYLPIFVDKFNAKKNDPKVDRGLMTGYSFFDFATNGLKPADYVLIAGETGFGKSLLLNNMAIQVWLQKNKIIFPVHDNPNPIQDIKNLKGGKDIIFFSLEMPYEDCFNRLLSRLAGVATRKIENADLTKEEFVKIKICLDFIKEYPFTFKIVDITDVCANDLEVLLTEYEEKFDAVFIDYLGIMTSNEKSDEQDWLKQGSISREIRSIGRKYKIPIFSAVQLNRKGQGKDSSESIGLNRLARSASIAHHATHVLQIESRIQEDNHSDLSIHLIKCRRGPKGKGLLIKNLACATLLDKEDNQEDIGDDYKSPFLNQDDISEEIENLEL
jgi:replicative DNA helicase